MNCCDEFNENTLDKFLWNLKENHVEIHAITVYHDGKLMMNESFAPFRKDALHPLYSVTKSFTSLSFGYLYEERHLSLDEPWISFFPEYKDKASEKFCSVTLRNLLTMTLGQDTEVMVQNGDDWISQIVQKSITEEPGKKFFYNSMCSYLIGRLVEKLTGEKLSDYLNKRLFEPLGITDYTWEEDQKGHNMGGFGLHMRTEDLAKVGKCILDNGKYDGKDVIPYDWLNMATACQMENASEYPMQRSQNRQGYGYYFWMCTDDAFRCSGLHGQMCYINPKRNLVIALSSCTTGSQAILDCLTSAMECHDDKTEPIKFEIPLIDGERDSELLKAGTYKALENPADVESIAIKKHDGSLYISLIKGGREYSFSSECGLWHPQKNTFYDFLQFYNADAMKKNDNSGYVMFGNHGWTKDDMLNVQLRCLNSSTAYEFTFHIDPGYIIMDCSVKGLYNLLSSFQVVFVTK